MVLPHDSLSAGAPAPPHTHATHQLEFVVHQVLRRPLARRQILRHTTQGNAPARARFHLTVTGCPHAHVGVPASHMGHVVTAACARRTARGHDSQASGEHSAHQWGVPGVAAEGVHVSTAGQDAGSNLEHAARQVSTTNAQQASTRGCTGQRTSVSTTWPRISSIWDSVEADRKLALQKPQWRPLRLAACAIRRHSGSVETPPDAHVATPTAAAMAVTQHDATQRNATHRVGFIGTEQHEVVAGHASCERSLGTVGLGLKVLAHGQHKRIAVCHHDGHGQHLERPSDQAHACSRLGRMQAFQHSRRAEPANSQRSEPGQGT